MNPKTYSILSDIYYGDQGGAYGSVGRLHATVSHRGISQKDVQKFLEQQLPYRLHKQQQGRRRRRQRRHMMISGPGELSLDTMYLNKMQRAAFPFALVAQDMLTKYMMVRFMRKVNADAARNAFSKMVREYTQTTKFRVRSVFSDRGEGKGGCVRQQALVFSGGEFRGHFLDYCQKEGIVHKRTMPQNTNKSINAERMIR